MPYSDNHKWKQGRSKVEVLKILFQEKYRRFASNRINVLIALVIIMLPLMFLFQMFPLWTQKQDIQMYSSQGKINCLDKDFYIPYFSYCEQLGVRPNAYQH